MYFGHQQEVNRSEGNRQMQEECRIVVPRHVPHAAVLDTEYAKPVLPVRNQNAEESEYEKLTVCRSFSTFFGLNTSNIRDKGNTVFLLSFLMQMRL